MRIAMCQVNPTVGDVDGNARLVIDAVERAAQAGARLAILPEQVLSGYPAGDLWLKPHFVDRCWRALEELAGRLPIPAVIGAPERADGVLHNAAAWVADGVVAGTYRKQLLPTYAVFDEDRWFTPGADTLVMALHDAGGHELRVGVTICEDAWVTQGPVPATASAGADVVINLSASPWRVGRARDREQVVVDRARESGAWLLLCNQVGGQDGLVFDGASLAAAPDGTIVARGAAFHEDLVLVDVGADATVAAAARQQVRAEQELWEGLVLGLRDYVRKNGFTSVVLGLSGGIDSAVVCALAVDALGADAVHAATMPSAFTSDATRSDALTQAHGSGVTIHELAIEPIMDAFERVLAPAFAGTDRDVTEENLQARIRGTLLMALSNKHGHLVLATGNKSEMSVGYATLYGDMNGGYAPIRDVPKTDVFRLARWRNEAARQAGAAEPIPTSVIERPPSAELRPGQLDTDSLPDYDELDSILELLVEHDRGVEEAIDAGFEPMTVERIQRLVDRAEYKRRQAAPGTRVTSKAFDSDRRMPITNRFDGRLPTRAR